MQVEVDLPNADSSLLPGMYGMLKLDVSRAGAMIRVPDDALVFRDNHVYVPVVRSNRLHLAVVKLGWDDGRNVVVASGVAPGDLVALDVGEGVHEGDPVQPVQAAQS
jgi:HlyD family secretion protein